MSSDTSLSLVIPCFNAERHIESVIEHLPESIARIYCVDDASKDGTHALLQSLMQKNPKIRVISLAENQGVGGAMIAGYRAAVEEARSNNQLNSLIIIKMDSDNQMDPRFIPNLIAPIVANQADYTKGNRFYNFEDIANMPRMRVFGNICLSFLSKISTGYYSIFDPTNGYSAIHGLVAEKINWDKLHRRYFLNLICYFD